MIDTAGWGYYLKQDPVDKIRCASNLLYTPLVNPDGTIMCMHYDETSEYQKENTRLTKELVDFFFAREVQHIKLFQEYSWAPKILDIDLENRKVFIEWNKETLNDIIYTDGRDLNQECPTWKDQLFAILKDIVDSGHYKMALYPHCFFIDNNGKLKTFDFYSCISHEERYLEKSKIEGMLGQGSRTRFDEVTDNGLIDFEMFFKRTLSTHVKWPEDPFPEFYERLFND
jgi:hypothetical protein